MFEVVIGGWGNTRSVIRRARAGADIVQANGAVLSATEPRTFVLDWSTPRVLKLFSKSSSGALTQILETPQQPESVLDIFSMSVSTHTCTGVWNVQTAGPCPANSYCPGGNPAAAVACPANTVSLPFSTLIGDCKTALGYYMCNGLTAQYSGGACTGAVFNTALPCPAGYFCPQDLPNPLQCPSNTVSDAGAGSVVDCKASPGFFGDNGNAADTCPAGYYCAGGGSVVRCPVGTTSSMGASAAAQCTVMRSYYGSEGAAATQCPDFTTSPAGSTAVTDCVAKRGYFGNAGEPATQCPANFYCTGDGSQKACPEGTVSGVGSFEAENCVVNGKWAMKVYSAGGQALSTMPDVTTLEYVGVAYVPEVNFYGEDKFQAAVPGTPGDRFAATFQGRFRVYAEGSYTFCTNSDDGSDLSVDGVLVVDNGGLHATQKKCGSTVVAAGMHEASVNFFENGGYASCAVTWSGPDTNNEEVPLKAADSCAINPADLVGGWTNQAQIGGEAVKGTWNNRARPDFTIAGTDVCGVFLFTFPDDRVYRGELSEDKSRIVYSPDNVWPRTAMFKTVQDLRTAGYQPPDCPHKYGPAVDLNQHCGGGGWSVTLHPGSYPRFEEGSCDDDAGMCVIKSCGMRYADLSSLSIPSGLKVTLYDQPNFGGASIDFSGPQDIGCLVAKGWNDRARSMRITQI